MLYNDPFLLVFAYEILCQMIIKGIFNKI